MQRKILKNVLLGGFLTLASSFCATYAASSMLNAPAAQAGYFFGLGYTYGYVKNADVKDFKYSTASGTLPPSGTSIDNAPLSYKDAFGGGSGAFIKFGRLFQNHFGYEVNVDYIHGKHSFSYSGLAQNSQGSGTTQTEASLTKKTNTYDLQALALYNFQLNYNWSFLAKLGVGFQHQKDELLSDVTQGATSAEYSYSQKHNSAAGIAGGEFRYYLTQHWALGFEADYTVAKENVLAGSFGTTYRF